MSKIEKWQRWVEGPIKNEVIRMHAHRAAYREVASITQAHGALAPSSFFEYLGHWYAASQSSAIRRQAEASTRVISLGALLSDIGDHPHLVTRAWYATHAEDEWGREGNRRTFDREYGGAIRSHVDPALIAADLATLRESAARVKAHVDRVIAHADSRPPRELLTFADINAVIDVIGDTFKRYAALLTGAWWHTLVPIPQYDWLGPFREPWIRPGDNRGTEHWG